MATPAESPPVRAGYRGLLALARALDRPLVPHQRTIARAAFGAERECVAVVPRGNAKTSTAAMVALHHLLTVPDASVSLGAATRELAAIAYSVMRTLAEHPFLDGRIEARAVASARGALRVPGGGVLRVLSGRGERAVGQTDSLMVLDEAWNLRDGGLLDAFQTALIKRADARLLVISTPATSLDSPLGAMRARALAGEVAQRGSHIDAHAPGLRWLDWGLPENASLDDLAAITRANPAPWITRELLAEQRERVAPWAWATMHAGRWGVGEAAWLPAGAWTACRQDGLHVEAGEQVALGIDVGGGRAESAVVAVTDDLRVAAVEVLQGDGAVLEVTDAVRRLAARYAVREVAFDPWRWQGEALRLEAEGIGPDGHLPAVARPHGPRVGGPARRDRRGATAPPRPPRPRPPRRQRRGQGHRPRLAPRAIRPRPERRRRHRARHGRRARLAAGARRGTRRVALSSPA